MDITNFKPTFGSRVVLIQDIQVELTLDSK